MQVGGAAAIGGRRALRRARLAVAAVALLAGLVVAAPALAGGTPIETQYVGQLRTVSDETAAAAAQVSGLSKADTGQVRAGGQRLLKAMWQAKEMLRTYRGARTRHGTDEEYRRVKGMLADARSGLARFGRLAGDPTRVKRRDRSFAQKQLQALLKDKLAARAAKTEVGRWLGDGAIRDVLNANGLQAATSSLGAAVQTRLRKQTNALVKRTLRVGLDVGAPLGPQLKRLRAELLNRARQAAVDWLARAVLKSSPTGLVMELVGRPIVRFVERQLREAFRGKRNLRARTERTLKGFARHHTILESSKDDDRLDVVERRIARAANALAATGFLKKDLRRAAKPRRCGSRKASVRRSCEAARDHLRALEAAESGPEGLETWIAATRARFLLDSDLANADFNRWIDELKNAERRLQRMLRNLPKAPPAASSWTGKWDTSFGVMTLTQSGNSVSGDYTHEGGMIIDGTVTTVNGQSVLSATWTESENLHADPAFDRGRISFTMSSDGGSFSGSWNYSVDAPDGSRGGWSGRRCTAASPCPG